MPTQTHLASVGKTSKVRSSTGRPTVPGITLVFVFHQRIHSLFLGALYLAAQSGCLCYSYHSSPSLRGLGTRLACMSTVTVPAAFICPICCDLLQIPVKLPCCGSRCWCVGLFSLFESRAHVLLPRTPRRSSAASNALRQA